MRELQRTDPRNRLLQIDAMSPDTAQGTVVVDQTHPFFYDHPLDHVPGLLLIETAMQAAEAWAAAHKTEGLHPEALSVRFTRYCLHGRPISWRLGMTAQPGGRYALRVLLTQDETPRAEVALMLARASALKGALHCDVALPDMLHPAEPAALNKHNPANVMISEPVADDAGTTAWMLPPDPGNLLADGPDDAPWHPLWLLEGWMQMLRHTNARAAESRGRMRDILIGIEAEFPNPARRDLPIRLQLDDHETLRTRFLTRCGTAQAEGHELARFRLLTARPRTANSETPAPQFAKTSA